MFYIFLLYKLNIDNIRNIVRDHALHWSGFQTQKEAQTWNFQLISIWDSNLEPALSHLKQLDTFSYVVWTRVLQVLESKSSQTRCASLRHGHQPFVVEFYLRFRMFNNFKLHWNRSVPGISDSGSKTTQSEFQTVSFRKCFIIKQSFT